MNPDISYVARFDDEEEEDERRSADEDYEYDHDYDPIYYAEKCFTVAIVGSCGVGKTALTFQFVNDMKYFVEAYFPTVEDEYLLERKVGDQSQKIKLVDTSGHEDYRQLCQNTGVSLIHIDAVAPMYPYHSSYRTNIPTYVRRHGTSTS
eukprot:m.111650 g.111650  ORF g.111650 m.111650 type:complete len:149 (-) comp13454_c0_seq1:1098-1544(-)